MKEELIGSLWTFKLELEEDKKENKKEIASPVESIHVNDNADEGDDLVEVVALLTIDRVVKKLNRRMKKYFPSKLKNDFNS